MFLNQQLSSFAAHWWRREADFLCTQRERRVVLIPLCTLPQFTVPFVFPAHANYASISATACLFACFVCSLVFVQPLIPHDNAATFSVSGLIKTNHQ